MIKTVLITGFLGTGKTTLLTSLLDAYADTRIGVIVNEFGKLNTDALMVKREGLEMAELSNGSIFCAWLKENFVQSLIEMSSKDIEYLFIEASGLADPSSMPQILGAIGNKTYRDYEYKGSICIIDSENYLKLYELLPALQSQVESSCTVIVNKADMVDKEELDVITRKILNINPAAYVYTASYCRVDIRDLVEGLRNHDKAARESGNTVESRPKALALTGGARLPYNMLQSFLKEIAGSTYRIKGFADTDRGAMKISTVGKHVSLSPWEGGVKGTEIVVISSIGVRIISETINALDKYLKGKIRL